MEYEVFKLYTIGDCYVIIGVIDANDRDPYLEACSVIQIGFEMINIIKNVRNKIGFQELNMRIGIHTVMIVIML